MIEVCLAVIALSSVASAWSLARIYEVVYVAERLRRRRGSGQSE